MHRFNDLDEVQFALQRLMQREPPLAKVLPRQPGTKESRYVHLLAGDVETTAGFVPTHAAPSESVSNSERVERLEENVALLQREVEDLKQQFANFRKQFD